MADDKYLKDESKGPKKNKDKKSGPKASAKAKPVSDQSEPDEAEELDMPEQKISLFLAVGLIVSALVVGLVIGYIVAPKGQPTVPTAPIGAGTAPALTPEQLDSTRLPASHPALPGTEAPSESTQSNTKTPEDQNQSGQSPEATE